MRIRFDHLYKAVGFTALDERRFFRRFGQTVRGIPVNIRIVEIANYYHWVVNSTQFGNGVRAFNRTVEADEGVTGVGDIDTYHSDEVVLAVDVDGNVFTGERAIYGGND